MDLELLTEEQRRLLKVFARMPEKRRRIFMLWRAKQHTYDEIAEIVHLPRKRMVRELEKALYALALSLNV
jgi:DNA-directed RNA polymerase specialized sigma24 family protein